MVASEKKASAPPNHPCTSTAQNIKETLESIVVAFVLAFVFRAFIVEAFVIPTGSMAITLYGEQVTSTCSTCGYEYARGITQGDAVSVRSNPAYAIALRCPNCDTLVDQVPPPRIARPDSGDRILVHKWPFDIGGKLLGPKRWDVTVFKDPRDGDTNYIKRLVGLPGEILEIIDGDIYAAPFDVLRKEAPDLLEEFDQLRREVCHLRQSPEQWDWHYWQSRYDALNERLLPYLEIQRKTPEAQKSLWFNVYNHDYLPNYQRFASQPTAWVSWEPVGPAGSLAAEAWNTTQREITFESDSHEPLAIQFTGKPIDDYCAYNYRAQMNQSHHTLNPVGDLRLRFSWFPEAGLGSISLEMSRDPHRFVVEIAVDGTIRIDRHHPSLPGGRERFAEMKRTPFASGKAVQIELINVDYRLSLLIDGEAVVATDYPNDLPAILKRQKIGGPPPQPSLVRISAQQLRCRFRHLILERDEYYRATTQNEPWTRDPKTGQQKNNPYCRWPGWGTWGCPIMLRDGTAREYYMLGDNSPASKDSRLWWEVGPHLHPMGDEYQVGTVPEDQLIGKAFFVYWPAGYRPSWSPGIGLIPNVGRMRWIR